MNYIRFFSTVLLFSIGLFVLLSFHSSHTPKYESHILYPRANRGFFPEDCSNFGQEFVDRIYKDPLLVREINSTCLRLMPVSTVAQFGEIQVANLVRKEQDLPACAGLDPARINSWNSNAFLGMTTRCLEGILPDTFGSIVDPQKVTNLVYTISGNVCRAITAGQLAALNPKAYSGFTDLCINQLRDHAIPGIVSAEQSRQLNKVVENYHVCRGFKNTHLNLLTTAAYSGFTAECVASILPSNFQAINSTTSIAALSPEGCNGLSAPQLTVLNETLYSAFTPECFLNITQLSIGGINTSSKLNNLRMDVFTRMNYTQISGLPGVAFISLNHDRWLNVARNSANQEIHPCFGLTGDQMKWIPLAYYEDITLECWKSLTPEAFTFLNENQIRRIPEILWASITAPQWARIGPAVLNYFEHFDIFGTEIPRNSELNPCFGVTRDQALRFSYTVFQAFAKQCEGLSPYTTQSGLNNGTESISPLNKFFFVLLASIFLFVI